MSIIRFYAKELIGFSEVELEFEKGLTVFTGASGSGKSVLMEGILSVFGYKDPKALNAEAQVESSFLYLSQMGMENEEPNTFRYLKKDKARYFVNANAIARKDLSTIAKLFSSHLSSKEENDFTDQRLLAILDSFIVDEEFLRIKEEYRANFEKLYELKKELSALKERALKAAEERDFLEFELKKFAEIDPQNGEEERLLTLKKELSKKEKLTVALTKAEHTKTNKNAILELFDFLGKNMQSAENFFAELEEMVNEVDFKLSELEGVDIDSIFERLEKLSYLNKRYGGINEAIEYFEKKKKELKELSNLDSSINSLELDIKSIEKTVLSLSVCISEFRGKYIQDFENRVAFFAKKLLITQPSISMTKRELSILGADKILLQLGSSAISTLSAGEHRRLRLALMACENNNEDIKAVLFLDEADANLSGEESAGVAYLLRELSVKYQIFAISHQPQLASVAAHHFMVSKDLNGSYAKKLTNKERAIEIARMVSGDKITKEALVYAKKLLAESKSKK